MYTVDKILDKNIDAKSKKPLYLVKWKGWGAEDCSWESDENLRINCSDIIAKFQQQFGHLNHTSFGLLKFSKLPKVPKEKRILKTKKIHKKSQKQNSQKDSVENSCLLNMNEQISDQKDQKKQQNYSGSLHRRQSIDRIVIKNSSFQIVDKPTSQFQWPENEKTIAFTFKKFTPIILPLDQNENMKRLFKSPPQSQIQKSNKNASLKPGIDIIGMKKLKEGLQFYVIEGQQKIWVKHQYLLKNYPKDLCCFYEKHISFDN